MTTGSDLSITVYAPGWVQKENSCPLTLLVPPMPIDVGIVLTSRPFS